MGQLTLPESSVIYVDTVVVIYSIEKFPNYFPLLEPLWQKLQAGTVQVMTSEITLLETLVMPIRQSNAEMIRRYEMFGSVLDVGIRSFRLLDQIHSD